MSFTHYPKTYENLVTAFQWPPPPVELVKYKVWEDTPEGEQEVERELPHWNLLTKAVLSEDIHTCYIAAQPFTKFYGTLFSSQPLEVEFHFANNVVNAQGGPIVDEDLPKLNYDGTALKFTYDKEDPKKNKDAFMVIIHGSWLRVRFKHLGKDPIEELRLFVRGSVF